MSVIRDFEVPGIRDLRARCILARSEQPEPKAVAVGTPEGFCFGFEVNGPVGPLVVLIRGDRTIPAARRIATAVSRTPSTFREYRDVVAVAR
jgi:hypothetical protein